MTHLRALKLVIVTAICTAAVPSALASAADPEALPPFLNKWGTTPTETLFVKPGALVIDGTDTISVCDQVRGILRFTPMAKRRGGFPAGRLDEAPERRFTCINRTVAADEQDRLLLGRFDSASLFTPTGTLLSSWVRPIGVEPGQFHESLSGFAYANGRITTIESGDLRRVQVFDSAGAYVTGWGGRGDQPGQFERSPSDIATDKAGNVYVAHSLTASSGCAVTRFSPTGQLFARWKLPCTAGEPKVAIAPGGRMYVYAGFAFLALAPDGTIIGKTEMVNGSKDGAFERVDDIQVDSQGGVYVLDGIQKRVQHFGFNVAPRVSLKTSSRSLRRPINVTFKVSKPAAVTAIVTKQGASARLFKFRVAGLRALDSRTFTIRAKPSWTPGAYRMQLTATDADANSRRLVVNFTR